MMTNLWAYLWRCFWRASTDEGIRTLKCEHNYYMVHGSALNKKERHSRIPAFISLCPWLHMHQDQALPFMFNAVTIMMGCNHQPLAKVNPSSFKLCFAQYFLIATRKVTNSLLKQQEFIWICLTNWMRTICSIVWSLHLRLIPIEGLRDISLVLF